MQRSQGHHVVTPEAVPLALDLAGLGSRMIATLIDGAIQFGIFFGVALFLAGTGIQGTPALVLVIVVVFLLFWGYFVAFEGLWGGRTPGKRAQRLRVVRVDGQPVGWTNVVVRNLLRVVDVLPGNYAVGAMFVLLGRRSQRLGDLAAGTLVVRERKAEAPAPLQLTPAGTSSRGLDAAGLGEREYALLRSFLERRATLDPTARRDLAAQVAATIRPRVAHAERAPWPGGDEAFLEAVAVAYRNRFGGPSMPPPPPPPPG